jgi:hypothetical protein
MPEVLHLRAPARPERRGARGARAVRRHPALLPRHDVAAFRAAVAVVALAVADDAYVDPEPGVTAGDHIVSGLVPLAVVALLIATANRMPSLLRGWLAIFGGALALVGGITDGVRHILVDRLSGDDVTAVLGGLAGVVLVLLGAATLWRSRRRDGSRLRRAAIGLAVLASTILLVLPTAIAIVATHKARSPVVRVNLGRPFESVTLTTSDGLTLRGWYVASRNGAAVIAFPGRTQPVPHARMLMRHGYGVLLLDRRGEGASEGDYNAFGWGGERDLRAAVRFLQRRADVDPTRIGGLGLSVGGELLLQTAAHTSDLRAVVSEGAGQRSLAEHLDNPELGTVQRWFTGMAAQTAAVAVLSNGVPPDGLADLVPRIAPRPVLLIEAEKGNPDEVLNEVYDRAAGESSELWKVSRGGHTGALAAAPAQYEQRVVGFFDRALLGERPPS